MCHKTHLLSAKPKRGDDLSISAKVVQQDELRRQFILVDEYSAGLLDRQNHAFWSTRNMAQMPESIKREIINDQSWSDTVFSRPATEKLHALIDAVPDGQPFSMLEIGAANGTVLRKIGARKPDLDFAYVGFECLPLFCEDFEKNFPQHKIFVGDVDVFEQTDLSEYNGGRFSLFYANVVFIMMRTELVRRALKKAAAHTDTFLIYDFMNPPEADIARGESMAIISPGRPVFWFVHPWKELFAEVGFEIVDSHFEEPSLSDPKLRDSDQQYRGIGYMHAVRSGTA